MSGSSYLNNRLALSRIQLCCLLAVLNMVFPADSLPSSIPSETSIDYTMHRLATEYNDPSAQYLVGRNYLKGKSVEKNIKEAIKWFELAAKQNHVRAQYQLGILYLYGKEIKTNLNYAYYFLSKAAEKNHLDSQYELGNYYLKGNANKRQFEKAAEWYRKAADRGHVRAQYELGKLLYEGQGVKQDHVEAIRLLSEASESGLLEAGNYLSKLDPDSPSNTPTANLSVNGNSPEVESDLNFTLGTNSDDSLDHYQLGIAYLTGDGKAKNVHEASQHFQIAAKAGHGKAQYQLAKLYEQGVGVKQSDKLYLQWHELHDEGAGVSGWRARSARRLRKGWRNQRTTGFKICKNA